MGLQRAGETVDKKGRWPVTERSAAVVAERVESCPGLLDVRLRATP